MKKLAAVLPVVIFVLFASSPTFAKSATAVLQGTEPDSKLSGMVHFEETAGGLKINASVENAAPGRHGFHIHQNGACGDTGKAAGDHFNPDGVSHGFLLKDGFAHAHAGDLGNLEIGADGKGRMEAVVPQLTLGEGRYSVAGRSVIFHAKEDDFGQPTGNAGARLGCGVIVMDGLSAAPNPQ